MGKKSLFETVKIRNTTIKNRICVPPMITFGSGDKAGAKRIRHYRDIAAGGAGLIIAEATCVTDTGQLGPGQMGIWDDSHIDGLREMAQAVHEEGGTILLQIHHAGVVGCNEHLCPDAYQLNETTVGKKMTIEDIVCIQEAFIHAGRRACEAGFDGVELHGCHSYLISQFLNKRVNRRGDIYGREPEKFPVDILKGIRKLVSADFIVGIRLGAFEPTLEDGIRYAKVLEQAGFDFLDISYGFFQEHEPSAPAGFPFQDVIYGAEQIKKACAVPVFAVNQIRTPEQAQQVLEETDVDMVDIGRAVLVDCNWANKARNGDMPNPCIGCKTCCWFPDGSKCPGRIRAEKQAGQEPRQSQVAAEGK